MLTYGINLTQQKDALQKITLDKVVHKIKQPRPEFKERIDQLRRIKELNPKQYKQLKTGLPYFCCGIFNPAYRKKDNFASINTFTLDFDHFEKSHLEKDTVFKKLSGDERLRFLFTSPGGDGLKAIFKLSEGCHDPGKYAHFYKSFAQKIVKKYGLEDVIDWVTHDVTRATFFSADTEAWDNPISVPVEMGNYISDEITSQYDFTEKSFKKAARENKQSAIDPSHAPDADALLHIKKKLNPSYRPKKQKQVYVPQELHDVIPLIEEELAKEDIKLTKLTSIHYGKQIRIGMEQYWAELNVFYGQKGFSVVKSTKTGGNAYLTELAYQLIDTLLNE